MSAITPFVDTNVLLYLLSTERAKADRAVLALAAGFTISVQVLNEFVHVATRKFRMNLPEVREFLSELRRASRLVPVDEATHDAALLIAGQYGISIYDACIVAAAQIAGCNVLLSEDFQNGQKFPGDLRVRNPFTA